MMSQNNDDEKENEKIINTLVASYKILEEKLTTIDKKLDIIDKKLDIAKND